MKMLRVVFVVSNFQEAPNGGGAGGNQAPAGPSSLRERCDGRGIKPHPRRQGFARRGIADKRKPRKIDCIKPKLQRCGALGGSPDHPGIRSYTNGCRPARPATAATTAPPWGAT